MACRATSCVAPPTGGMSPLNVQACRPPSALPDTGSDRLCQLAPKTSSGGESPIRYLM
jgi:hypothetical protein